MKKLSVICIILTLFWVGCEDSTEPEVFDTSPPTINIPLDNEIIRDTNVVTVRWKSVVDAVSYDLEVSTEPDFSVFAYSDSLADTTSITTALTQSIHYWRVKGENAIGEETVWSSVSSFLLDGPEAPVLISPTPDSVFFMYDEVTVEWNSSEFASLYEVNISNSMDFVSIDFADTIAATILVTTTLIFDPDQYYVRVRAQNSVGFWGDWGSSTNFWFSD